jgi:hypothetical protein
MAGFRLTLLSYGLFRSWLPQVRIDLGGLPETKSALTLRSMLSLPRGPLPRGLVVPTTSVVNMMASPWEHLPSLPRTGKSINALGSPSSFLDAEHRFKVSCVKRIFLSQ